MMNVKRTVRTDGSGAADAAFEAGSAATEAEGTLPAECAPADAASSADAGHPAMCGARGGAPAEAARAQRAALSSAAKAHADAGWLPADALSASRTGSGSDPAASSSVACLLNQAKAELAREGFTCVACTSAGEMHTSRLRGVRPLLELLDAGVSLEGGVAADKVIGNGAANIYVLLRASAVHGLVMSRQAHGTLQAHGIAVSADEMVERIANRTGDGFCPMELAVEGIDDPVRAVAAVRRRMAELAGAGPAPAAPAAACGPASVSGPASVPATPAAPSEEAR